MTTVATEWLAAVEAKRPSFRILAVAKLFAEQADEEGYASIGRRYIEKASHAGSVLDAAKALKSLLGSEWLVVYKDDDMATNTPRTFRLAIPKGNS